MLTSSPASTQASTSDAFLSKTSGQRKRKRNNDDDVMESLLEIVKAKNPYSNIGEFVMSSLSSMNSKQNIDTLTQKIKILCTKAVCMDAEEMLNAATVEIVEVDADNLDDGDDATLF